VRFPAPVRVGSRVRGSGELVEAERQKDGSVQAKVRVTVEIEGGAKPACVAETISRYYPA
jgi:acyl dehydratase